ncbi:MAG: hypothetical protein ABII09_06250 [Planctomycetota bacterium]
MINTLWRFEQNVSGLQPLLLLVIAVVTLAAGLFVCLSGFGFRKSMFAVIGMYCGIALAISIAGFNLLLALAFLGAGVLSAMKLQDSFLVLITSIFAAVYGFSVLIRPYFSPSDDLMSVMRQLTIGVPYYNWPILLALTAAPLAVSSTFWRGTSSALCSAAGTLIIFAGAIMLSKYTGFSAVGHISGKPEIYLGLFVGITAVVACVQYFILPKISSRFAAAKESTKAKAKRAKKRKTGDGETISRTTAWRTS